MGQEHAREPPLDDPVARLLGVLPAAAGGGGRAARPGGPDAAGLAAVHRAFRPARARGHRPPLRPRRPVPARRRRLLPAVRHRRPERARLAARAYPRRGRGGGGGARRPRPRPARRPARGARRRPLRAEPPRRRGPPARPPDRRQPRMAAPAGRPHPARRPLPALPRLRARPRPGRRLVGARRPHPGALGRRLRAREPGRHLAHLLRPLRRGARPPPRRLLPHLPRCAPGPRRQPRRARRHPDAGAAHRHLLRARLDRPLPRLHAARRRGPDGRARPGHGAHRRRSAPHQRPLAPAGLRLRRPARARRRLPPRHPRPRRRRPRRHRHPRQRARLRRSRDPRAPRLHAAHRPGAARRGSDPAQHRHLVVRPAGRARACPRQQGPDDDRLGALHPPAVRDRRDHRPRPAVPRQGQALVRRLARDRRRRPRRTGGRHPLDHPRLCRRRAWCRGR